MDNELEFISTKMADWAEKNGVDLTFTSPGKPTQNALAERFNRTYRTEVLDMYLFNWLPEVRDLTERWMVDYNEQRTHQSLNQLSPVQYRRTYSPGNL